MDRIEPNDLAHIRRLGLNPIAAQPAPLGGNAGINPHVTRFALTDGRWADVFHVKPVYYEAPDGSWRPLSEIAAYHGNRRIELKPSAWGQTSLEYLLWLTRRQRLLGSSLGYAGGVLSPERLEYAGTLTVRPDPNPESTTVDGYVEGFSSATWATIHDGATGGMADDWSTDATIRAGLSGGFFTIRRGFYLFDTSSIPDAARKSSATLALRAIIGGITNGDNDGDDWINVVQSSPASNTALATGDYDACGDAISNPTEGATRIDLGSLTDNAYNTWTLDSTGLGWVDLAGVTKLGVREGHDCLNSPISSGVNGYRAFTADQSGTGSDPVLTVIYDPAGGGADPLRPFIHNLVR